MAMTPHQLTLNIRRIEQAWQKMMAHKHRQNQQLRLEKQQQEQFNRKMESYLRMSRPRFLKANVLEQLRTDTFNAPSPKVVSQRPTHLISMSFFYSYSRLMKQRLIEQQHRNQAIEKEKIRQQTLLKMRQKQQKDLEQAALQKISPIVWLSGPH